MQPARAAFRGEIRRDFSPADCFPSFNVLHWMQTPTNREADMRRTHYPIHRDFRAWARMNPPLKRPLLPWMQRAMGLLSFAQRSSGGVSVKRLRIPVGGKDSIRALLYSPDGAEENAPCLLYFHGGGFVFPAAPYHYALARIYARRANCRVLLVDYRLAPAHPFPAAPEDCYAAYRWLLERGRELGVDARRIAVGGDSAGGQLATVAAMMARDRGVRPPCAQMLIYPCTDRRMQSPSMQKYVDTPMCNRRDMQKYVEFYLPGLQERDAAYASPMEAESLADLPPAYIETAEFDCLHDEALAYARRLREAGCEVNVCETRGTMHGYDIVLKSPIVQESLLRRVEFLCDHLHPCT